VDSRRRLSIVDLNGPFEYSLWAYFGLNLTVKNGQYFDGTLFGLLRGPNLIAEKTDQLYVSGPNNRTKSF
jgi:hypothetical protein